MVIKVTKSSIYIVLLGVSLTVYNEELCTRQDTLSIMDSNMFPC